MLKLYAYSFAVSLLVSLAATPLSIYLSRRFNVMDAIDPRKIHVVSMPRWGGIGIMAGFFAGLLGLWSFSRPFHKLLKYSQGIVRNGHVVFTLNLGEQLAGILFGVFMLFIVGLVDDRKPVPATVKFLLQIIAAFVAMMYGVRIYGLGIPGMEAYAHFPIILTQLITVLWIVGLTNAVNLIDGLDGLAGGVVAIVAGSFLAVALIQEKGLSVFYDHQIKLAGVVAAAVLGGTLGFLVYNFHPARVFMGDGGSLSLGFLVGCIAVIGTFKTTMLAVLVVPFLLVALPIMDMTVAFGRRLFNKQNPFMPDRGHFHHRLIDRGWTQREVVLLIYVITMALSLISLTAVGIRHG